MSDDYFAQGNGQQGSYQQNSYQQNSFQQGGYVPYDDYVEAEVIDESRESEGFEPPRKKKKMESGTKKTFLVSFIGAACACVLCFGIFWAVGGLRGSSTVIGGSGTTITASGESVTLATAVAQKALPSVVNIDVYTKSSSYSMYNWGTNGSTSTLTQSSLGSGVIISADGYVLTNYHVIEGASALKVTADGSTYDADVVGTDASSDLAVIKLKNASDLTAIELGDSDKLVVGEWVMSIGSPYGLEQSVATGIVSATSRSTVMSSESNSGTTMVYTNMIQTDAAINPGNSGGALVDANGDLIGINTLITSSSGSYSGVGFAIPVNYATSIAKQLIEGKTPSHAQLGVTLVTITSEIAARYNLSVNEGAYIQSVSSGSAADKAGIKEGDIVTSFNGKTITSASDLLIAIREKSPGDTVKIELVRNGKTMEVSATLGSDA